MKFPRINGNAGDTHGGDRPRALVRYFDLSQAWIDESNRLSGGTHLPGRYLYLPDLRAAAIRDGLNDVAAFLDGFGPDAVEYRQPGGET